MDDARNLSWLTGLEIIFADSDLQSFALTVEDGQTLTVRSELRDVQPALSFIAGTLDQNNAKPTGPSAGCTLDWSWLAGRQIASAESDLRSLLLTLAGGQTLMVRAELWQGRPFVSFTPAIPLR